MTDRATELGRVFLSRGTRSHMFAHSAAALLLWARTALSWNVGLTLRRSMMRTSVNASIY
jgi:hypothetical protein